MNFSAFIQRGHFSVCCFLVIVAATTVSKAAAEYEVQGKVRQSIAGFNGSKLEYSNEFTVYVRDCSWLIKIIETNGNGGVWQRELGSTNGTEIFESGMPLDGINLFANRETVLQAFISSNTLPVDRSDDGIVGHLWLMFASQCYWTSLRTSRLTPVFDWRASVGVNPKATMEADWELLGGPGSLPREVTYLGQWDQTNGLYRITGTNSVEGTLIPSGFTFEECHAGPFDPNKMIYSTVVRKRVEAVVTSVRSVCSRMILLPVLGGGRTAIVDWRLKERNSGNSVPSYIIQDSKQWPSVEEAKGILKAAEQAHGGSAPTALVQSHRTPVLVALVCAFMLGPLGIYFLWKRSTLHTG
jgi:hypothetical protein